MSHVVMLSIFLWPGCGIVCLKSECENQAEVLKTGSGPARLQMCQFI